MEREEYDVYWVKEHFDLAPVFNPGSEALDEFVDVGNADYYYNQFDDELFDGKAFTIALPMYLSGNYVDLTADTPGIPSEPPVRRLRITLQSISRDYYLYLKTMGQLVGSSLLNTAGACYEHMAAAFLKACRPRFFGVSRAVCRWLEHFGIRAEGQLYNAVDPAEVRALANAADRVDWRQKLGLPADQRLAVYLGRVIPEKGVAELIRAFTAAAPAGCSLVVAGDGPLLPQLRENCPPHVYLAGAVPYAQAMQLLAQAQLYCLPTYYAEGFPTTFLEAAACGCPILTTRTGGSDELLPDERYGVQLDGVEETALAAALTRCLEDETWRCQAARLTGQRLEERFTWDAVTTRLLELAGTK